RMHVAASSDSKLPCYLPLQCLHSFPTRRSSDLTLNLLDRHLAAGADNRVALIWEGEGFESRFFTYRMLSAEVNRSANVLKSFGVDRKSTRLNSSHVWISYSDFCLE